MNSLQQAVFSELPGDLIIRESVRRFSGEKIEGFETRQSIPDNPSSILTINLDGRAMNPKGMKCSAVKS